MPRFAAIDVGSNALRLRVVEVASDGFTWVDVATERAPVRLGADVFQTGRLAARTLADAVAALRQFQERMEHACVDAYRAVATSAVREANNGGALVDGARSEAGIALEVIDGIEEARLVRTAVLRRVGDPQLSALLADVGGGSTELTILHGGKPSFVTSLPLGTVRLLDVHLREQRGEASAYAAIDRVLAPVRGECRRAPLPLMIGTGGNIDALAVLAPSRDPHHPGVDVQRAAELLPKLALMPLAERARVFGLRSDRADTIVPAAMIFLRLANLVPVSRILAPGTGLREGLLEELAERWAAPPDAQ